MKESIFELKEVMNYIKYEWPQCLEENANPLEMAIQLLDDSSVGLSHKLPEYEDISERTSASLRLVVTDHYEMFNNSVGSYHTLLNSTKENQKDAEEIKSMLEATTKEIHDKSDILQELNQTSMRYSEMIEILDAMEAVNAIPGKIDQLIVEKKIHQVYDIIAQGYSTAEQYNLWNLGVMSGIKNYLDLQSNNLFDMIIEELLSEIYLKNPLTNQDQNIWEQLITSNNNPKLTSFRTFISKLNRLEQFIYNSSNLDINEISLCLNELINEFIDIQLPKLLNSESSKLTLTFNLSGSHKNYHYLYQLLLTASKLNRLMQATQILSQSNQQEFHGLLYRSIEEARLKNIHELNKLNKVMDFENEFDSELLSFNDFSVKILKDLFSSIFLKSLIVLQKQKLVQEIVQKFDLEYDFKACWNIIKNELSNLLLSYITNSTTHVEHNHNFNEVFKFDPLTINKDLMAEKFPNLFETSEEFGSYNDELYIKSESFQSNLQVLVPINIFNMRIIMDFFLIFVSGVTNLLNQSSKPSNTMAIQFFESFMKISFLPKLRDNFDLKFNTIMGLVDYNNEDNELAVVSNFKLETINLNNSVIYENAYEFKKFFISLCYILNTSLTYRHELNDLVLQFLDKFHHSNLRFFNSIIGSSNVKLSNWIKTPALNDISALIINETDGINNELINKEIEIMLQDIDNILEVTKDDLLDEESVSQICHLLLTSCYILSWLPGLGKESNYNFEEDLTMIEKLKHDWNFLENGKKILIEETNSKKANANYDNLSIYLSLNPSKYDHFKQVIKQFEKIRLDSLIILRYDLRLKSIYFISKSFKLGDWILKNEPGDSDQFITKLNKELFSMENKVNNYLNEFEISKILYGMSFFLNELLIQGSRLIHKINSNGIKKLLVNTFTLQQMLKNLNKSKMDTDFKRTSYYFNLFTVNENQLPSKLEGYSTFEKTNMVRLLYSEKLADGNGSSFNISKYNDLLAKVK